MTDISTPASSPAVAPATNDQAAAVLTGAISFASSARARVVAATAGIKAADASVVAAAHEYASAKAQLIGADAMVEAARVASNPAGSAKVIHYGWLVLAAVALVAVAAVVVHYVW